MNQRDDIVIVKGYAPFSNKKEKLKIWKELKRELGDSVRVTIKDHFLHYSATVDRNMYF